MSLFRAILYRLNILGLLWSVVLCMSSFGLPYSLQYGGLFLFFGTYIVECIIDNRWHIQWNRRMLPFLCFLGFFLLSLINLLTDFGPVAIQKFEYRYPLLGFGLCGLMGCNPLLRRHHIFHTMMLTSVAVSICLLGLTGHSLFLPNGIQSLNETRIAFINNHMQFDFYLCATLMGVWYCWTHLTSFCVSHKARIVLRCAYILTALTCFSMVGCSEGRSGLIACVSIVVILAVHEIAVRNRFTAFATAAIMLVVSSIFVLTRPRVQDIGLTYDIRLNMWETLLPLTTEHPIFGMGIQTTQECIHQAYAEGLKEVHQPYFYTTVMEGGQWMDAHNQYLQTLLESGIIGLILLLGIYLLPPIVADAQQRFLIALLVLISMWQSCFDVFITGHFCLLYCLLITFSLLPKED